MRSLATNSSIVGFRTLSQESFRAGCGAGVRAKSLSATHDENDVFVPYVSGY